MKLYHTLISLLFACSVQAQTANPPKLETDTPGAVELDRLEVTADKEKDFSLPLDSTPTTGSRLGLTNRDLPVSVSVVTQEVMQLRGLRTAVEAVEAAVGMTGGTS